VPGRGHHGSRVMAPEMEILSVWYSSAFPFSCLSLHVAQMSLKGEMLCSIKQVMVKSVELRGLATICFQVRGKGETENMHNVRESRASTAEARISC
jgi:hypothetical protein